MFEYEYHSPSFSKTAATRAVRELYGKVVVEAQPLPSERDQNFLVRTRGGETFVFKIANRAEPLANLELQNAVLAHLAQSPLCSGVPLLIPALNGQKIGSMDDEDGGSFYARLVTYLPGRLLAQQRTCRRGLAQSLGSFLGRLDRALLDFPSPAAPRPLKWNLSEALWIRPFLTHIEDAGRRPLVEEILNRFEKDLLPLLPTLRQSMIHNDANDYNVLVQDRGLEGQEVTGIIDFGDLVYSCTLFEAAVACAYSMLDKPDPLQVAAGVVAGYHQVLPLSEGELELLFRFIQLRLAVSVTNSAWQRKAHPHNSYLQVTDQPAWQLLEVLRDLNEKLVYYRFREACGLEPHPSAAVLCEALGAAAEEFGPIIGSPDALEPAILDLSVGTLEIEDLGELDQPALLKSHLQRRILDTGGLRLGGYREVRVVSEFAGDPRKWSPGSSGRLHLGLDLFAPTDSPVLAPLEGTVHAAFEHQVHGPSLLLEHRLQSGRTFFALYGGLHGDNAGWLPVGAVVSRGQALGHIGARPSACPLPEHLHLQLFCELICKPSLLPGSVDIEEAGVWTSICPDPGLLLNRYALRGDGEAKASKVLRGRRKHLGPSLSLSYRKPIHVVRGSGQYLYDAQGRAYLDAVNNVAHVGHCHPRVVRAAQRQMAVLNTNTRYLHHALSDYAGRLCALFPESLSVCFLVCSGSEANELALRLARTHTGRAETIVLDGAYHGNTSALVDISPYKFDGPGGKGAPAHVYRVQMPDVYRGKYRSWLEAGGQYGAEVEKVIAELDSRGKRPGVFIYESLLGCGGQIVLPPGFLERSQRSVREAGGVCIADEVQVGFGRCGSTFWGFESQQVVPDIVTLGKPIGNGHPLGAVITTPEIAASFANGMEYFNTFGGNPVSCAVGMAVLDVLQEEDLQAKAERTGARLLAGLKELQQKHPLIGDVRGMGLFLGIELVLDRETLEPAPEHASCLVERMKENGVLLSTDGPFHNVLKVKPPLVFDEDNAAMLLSHLKEILEEGYFAESVILSEFQRPSHPG